MLIVTTNDLPGYKITKVIGEINGLTVRTRNVGAQIGASLKALGGGELRGLTKQLQESREEALNRLRDAAEAVGANAVLAKLFPYLPFGPLGGRVRSGSPTIPGD